MKMKSKFFGINAKMALAALAVCGLFTSCYEKEELDAPVLADPIYVITGNLVSASTGQAVNGTVSIGTETVTTTNGYFEKKMSKGGSFAITVDIAGYLSATRTVYLATVGKGETSAANADINLFDASTQVVVPEQDETATEEQAEAAKEALKTGVASIFAGIEGVDVSKITTVVNPDGTTTVTVPTTISKSSEPVKVTYNAIEGFTSTVTLADTKALTPGQIWLASAEKLLSKKFGYSLAKRTTTLSVQAGYSITGFKVIYDMLNRALTFNGKAGVVTYQDGLKVIPVYESHDTHNSHDIHGGNPGAGGGSSSNN